MYSVVIETVFLAGFVLVCAFAQISDIKGYSPQSRAKCLSATYKIRSFTNIPLMKCAKKCAVRPMCQAVNYHSDYLLCELLSQDFGGVSHHARTCVILKMSDISINLPTECDSCVNGETCDIDRQTRTGKCVINECKPLHLTHGQTFGNMYEIGSRIVYECDGCYRRTTDVEYSVCLSNGSWSGEPHCEPDYMTPPFCPGVVLSDGTFFQPAILESTYFFGSSCNRAASYCHSNGTWDTIPSCHQSVVALYMGCYQDCYTRVLYDDVYFQEDIMTTEYCIKLCLDRGYKFAFTEAYDFCFCGDELSHLKEADVSECNHPCKGNPEQMCGGFWRASLYDLTIHTASFDVVNTVDKCGPEGECIGTCGNFKAACKNG